MVLNMYAWVLRLMPDVLMLKASVIAKNYVQSVSLKLQKLVIEDVFRNDGVNRRNCK